MRRVAAGVLAALAVAVALRPGVAPAGTPVVTARHDLAAGRAVGEGDVEVRLVTHGAAPAGALADPAQVAGRLTVGVVRAGEPLTDVRLVGREAAVASLGRADAAGVPLRLADAAVAGVLRPGAVIDVVGAPGSARTSPAAVLAAGAVVLAVLPAAERAATGPVVVVALPAPAAAQVAAATLGQEVTVTLRG